MKPGDIHWIALRRATGHEQLGRRPAIVLQGEDFAGGSPLVIVVPLTGATTAQRFPGTLLIEPDDINGLDRTSVALVFQIRAVDRSIIGERIGEVGQSTIDEVYCLLDQLTGRSR